MSSQECRLSADKSHLPPQRKDKGMKIVAHINDCRQYSEDSWEPIVLTKELTEATTIGELVEWQKKLYKGNKSIQAGDSIYQMHISNME